MGVGPLCRLFPRVFRVVANRESSVKDCYCWVGDNVSWGVSVRRALHQSELVEFESSSSLLSNTFLCRDIVDCCIWKPDCSGLFSSKSFYRELDLIDEKRSCALVWMGLAPPRVEAFCWLAISGKISTAENLRRGLLSESISDICCLRKRKRESMDHLFIHNEMASTIWGHSLKNAAWNGASQVLPGGVVLSLGADCCYGDSFPIRFCGLYGKRGMTVSLVENNL